MQPKAGKVPRRKLDGVLLLDKSLGISSNHALQAVRRLYRAEKAGHTGTLDPLATGLLPLCFGEATKFSGELLNADKRYVATVQLGITTDTADAEGTVLQRRPVTSSLADVEAALAAFVGELDQVPPMYSALKRDGKPLYEYARAGIEVERAARRVCIHELRLLAGQGDFANGRFVFEVHCSKGTYVRTLAADIGDRLGCGAHLGALRRTGIGVLGVAQAYSLPMLEALTAEARDALLLPPDSLLASLAEAQLDVADATRLRYGQAVRWSGEEGSRLRVYDAEHRFIGICRQSADGWLQPQRLVAGV
ncbi:tRNA pseudouridine(55) synthase TruB [Sulfuritalea sp.]|uniref:tRNA pseudouridine(55) synthase TruB n=1 Tax=Sulfuritalea sp. TaxID=2480090 RepID=UPI00286E7E0A|nr:tRNA pseudouridine(55) synthase TruB [Sulfuritalea sp.]